jgi:carboxypeptidase Q
MKKLILLAAALPSIACAQSDKGIAWDIVEGLTTEVGPRLAGTDAEAQAREWAVEKLMSLGFSNVRIEPYRMPTWIRGEESGAIVWRRPGGTVHQKLALTALGNSGATPVSGLEGDIISVRSMDALKALPDSAVAGKIVYLTHGMRPTQDGSSYGYAGAARRQGPNIAAKKGAIAIVIRSIGTDSHRVPHTGNTNWDKGVSAIPAAAVSNPDADLIERLLSRWAGSSGAAGPRFKLLLTPKFVGQQKSGNVIAEIPGSDPDAGIVLVGGHLDSWDLGTGAIDDASGVAITTAAAAAFIGTGRQPRRSIRVVWFGAEEVGTWGAKAYFERHKADIHALAAESDFGADRVWRLDVKLPESAKPIAGRLSAALAPLGIAPSSIDANEGADIGPLVEAGVPTLALQQDGTRYFDLHHTADDTLDKIDPVQLAQNVKAWTLMLDIVANAPETLLPGPKRPDPVVEVMPAPSADPTLPPPSEPNALGAPAPLTVQPLPTTPVPVKPPRPRVNKGPAAAPQTPTKSAKPAPSRKTAQPVMSTPKVPVSAKPAPKPKKQKLPK